MLCHMTTTRMTPAKRDFRDRLPPVLDGLAAALGTSHYAIAKAIGVDLQTWGQMRRGDRAPTAMQSLALARMACARGHIEAFLDGILEGVILDRRQQRPAGKVVVSGIEMEAERWERIRDYRPPRR